MLSSSGALPRVMLSQSGMGAHRLADSWACYYPSRT
jgi:hypothetical protein